MFMKKNVIALFAALFMLVLVANAQQPAGQQKQKGPSIENRVEKMATDLGLTDVEKTALKDLMVKQEADMKKFRTEVDKESPDFKTKMKEIRTSQDAELKTLLGDDKYKKLQEIRAQMKKAAEQKPAAPAVQ
jgi:Spy/CpxP family protein refolding chaperone